MPMRTSGQRNCHWTKRNIPALLRRNTTPRPMRRYPTTIRRRSASAAWIAGSTGATAVVVAAWSASDPAVAFDDADGDGVEVKGAGRPGSGIRMRRTMYASRPIPPKNPRTTKTTLTKVGSTARYSAIPPHTPAMTRLVLLRSRRCGTETLPSLRVLVGDRDGESEGRRQRDARLLRRRENRAQRNGRMRHRLDGGIEELRPDGRRDGRQRHRDQAG